jgi:hypothetical protein
VQFVVTWAVSEIFVAKLIRKEPFGQAGSPRTVVIGFADHLLP